MAISLREDYAPRSVRFLEQWDCAGWRIKVYGIRYNGDVPESKLIEAGKEVATRVLPQPCNGDERYGVGFMGVHQGRGFDFVFVDWWAHENELHHHVYVAPSGANPCVLEPAGPAAPSVCVWDLAIQAHERQAWLGAVLTNPAGPNLDAYLAVHLNKNI